MRRSEFLRAVDAEFQASAAEATAADASGGGLPTQAQIIGAVQAASAPEDVVVQAAGSLPGDLHKLWRVRDPLGYHVEYAFSTMGYEIAGGLGAKRGLEAMNDDRDVIVMVGDGSYLMLHSELATAVDAFVHAPDVQAAFRQAGTDRRTGVPTWTLYGAMVQQLEALHCSFDEADKELGR